MSKRKKDQFSVTVVGIVIYSLILIAIVSGTYLGIKTFIKSREAVVSEAVKAAEEEMEEAHKEEAAAQAEEAPVEEIPEEPEEVVPEALPENLLGISK